MKKDFFRSHWRFAEHGLEARARFGFPVEPQGLVMPRRFEPDLL